MLLATSEYQLWNAVNKMPLSRVAALLSQTERNRIGQTVGEEKKNKYLKGFVLLWHVFLLRMKYLQA